MKGYYLFAPVEAACAGPESGMERKVRAQHKALCRYFDVELIILPAVEYSGCIAEKIVRRLPLMAAWRKWKYSGEFNDADFLYIRQVYHDASFARYLRAIRKQNSKIKIIYEVPTFPYLTEKKGSAHNTAFQKKEKRWCEKSAKYMDRIVTFYGQDEIWGVPCLKLINGFDFSTVTIPKRSKTSDVHMMSVAMTAFWHGYDRVIEGLNNYYTQGGKENVVYHLCGTELPELREATARCGLEDHVIFHGMVSGEALEEIYRISFLGLDVLGGHRKNYPVSSSLKSREYAAHGLPVITSSPVDYLPMDYPFQFLAPYDDSPLDINAVLAFYRRIYDGTDCGQVAEEIRAFSEPLCDMAQTMTPVADWLRSTLKE